MQLDTKLDLYDGVPKDHIDLQQGEEEPEKHIQSVDVQKEVLLQLVASQYDPQEYLHVNPVLLPPAYVHAPEYDDAKLYLYEGADKDHIDLQKGEGALLFGHRLTEYVFQVLLHLTASQYDPQEHNHINPVLYPPAYLNVPEHDDVKLDL